MFKRIFLFLLTNFLVIITISLLLNLLGVRPYLRANGIDYESLLAFCAIWGMGGAFINLLLSKFMVKMAMRVKVIQPQDADPRLQSLVRKVHYLAKAAGLEKMPEVGIYQSPEINAFATGPTKSRSLVAVSTGLLQKMDEDAVEGVLGHEIAHIANGDMVTMTLIQGVVNAFVLFLSRIIAFAIVSFLSKGRDEESRGMNYMIYHFVVFALDMLLMILGTIVVAWFSRYREFRADSGGAIYAGRDKMIKALKTLQSGQQILDKSANHPSIAALKISNLQKNKFLKLFSTHPPLEERIMRLEMGTNLHLKKYA